MASGGDSRNPRVADLADLECSVDLGKAEAGRFKVRAGLLGVQNQKIGLEMRLSQ